MNCKLYVDLDHTLGFYNASTEQWLMYQNALEALESLKKHLPICLITANQKNKVLKLFNQYPDLEGNLTEVLTCENIAPHFLNIIQAHTEWVRLGRIDAKANFLTFIYELWRVSPNLTLPQGTRMNGDHSQHSFESWEKEIYFPLIAPNKTRFCGPHDLLIDDEFANPNPNPIYHQMIQEGRAIFIGQRGVTTAEHGPAWLKMKQYVLNYIKNYKLV